MKKIIFTISCLIPIILFAQAGITPLHLYDGELYLAQEYLFNQGNLNNQQLSLTWQNTINTDGSEARNVYH